MGTILEEIYSDLEFMSIIGELLKNRTVLQMKEFLSIMEPPAMNIA